MINISITRADRTIEINRSGRRGPAGQGVPSGGTTGQVLQKHSNDNYDAEWVDKNSLNGSLSFIYAIMFRR